ncbi:MAG: signal peptidase II [Planctomycetota bacterium]
MVLAVGLVADLWSKQLAFERVAGRPVVITRAEVMATDALGTLIPRHDPVVVVPSVLEFTLVLNPGAVFGLGAGKRVLFIGFTIVAIVLGFAMFAGWTRSRDWIAHASIGLLLAGGLGNLYDRLTFACVRDFIHPLPGVTVAGREIWPYVSNVADALLIFGIVGLMVYLWTSDHHQTPRQDLDTGTSTDPGASKHESDGSAGTRGAE